MLSFRYSSGSQLKSFNSNGVVAIETSATGIELAKPKSCSIFIVEDHVSTTDKWEGVKRPKRDWFPGSVAYLPAGSELTSIPDHPYRENVLTLESERLISKSKAILDAYKTDPYYCEITSDDTSALARLIYELVSNGEHRAWPLLLDSLVLAMTVAISRHFSTQADKMLTQMEASSGLTSARLSRVFDYVETNIGRRIQLEQMAEAAALSPYHFSRSFKKATGKTPARYVMERRIREAMALLQSTEKSAAEIAHDCGFASQSHFAGAFKEEVGVTPGEFRRIAVS